MGCVWNPRAFENFEEISLECERRRGGSRARSDVQHEPSSTARRCNVVSRSSKLLAESRARFEIPRRRSPICRFSPTTSAGTLQGWRTGRTDGFSARRHSSSFRGARFVERPAPSALRSSSEAVTYKELDERANRLSLPPRFAWSGAGRSRRYLAFARRGAGRGAHRRPEGERDLRPSRSGVAGSEASVHRGRRASSSALICEETLAPALRVHGASSGARGQRRCSNRRGELRAYFSAPTTRKCNRLSAPHVRVHGQPQGRSRFSRSRRQFARGNEGTGLGSPTPTCS